ncbi:MAG: hypothetical protein KF787_10170 [Phycisphaeraceae bacterium]|nr:hypothetical protein [Phycisphaerae bacterium]MBX3392999.1 hypothetical protein [Phycisphaeraceae bacterium]HRJ50177.1 hypothetical protein [Phycisphaerales bacterium]
MPKNATSEKSERGSDSSQLRRNIILISLAAACIAGGIYFAVRGERPSAGTAVTPAVTRTADELTQRLQKEKESSEYSRRASQEPEFTGEPGEGRRAHTVDPPR